MAKYLQDLPVKIIAFSLAILFTGCTTNTAQAPIPELITPAASTIDTTFVERGLVTAFMPMGAVWNFARRVGVTRYISEPLYFDNPVAYFGAFHVLPGTRVVEGQLLATLDTEDLDERITEQQENINTMRHNHNVAYELGQINIDIMVLEHTRNLTRAADAFDANALEAALTQEFAIERAMLELRQQQERHTRQQQQAESRLNTLIERRQQTELRAPKDGLITGMATVVQGDTLSAAQPIIFISEATEIIIEAVNLPHDDWPPPPGALGQRPPQPWIPRPVRFANYAMGIIGDYVFELEYIELLPDERNPSGIPSPVRFRALTNQPLEAGQYVTMHFYTYKLEDVLRIPSNALFFTATTTYVYRIVEGEMVYTEIELYLNTPIYAAVREGLLEGDEIFVRP